MNGNGRFRASRKQGCGRYDPPEQRSRLTPTYTSLPTQTNTYTHTAKGKRFHVFH